MFIYYKNFLSPVEQKAFDTLVCSVTSLQPVILFEGIHSLEQIQRVFFAASRDVSEFFFIDSSYCYSFTDKGAKVKPHYLYSREVINQYLKRIGEMITTAVFMARNLTDFQALELFHDFLVNHTVYELPQNEGDQSVYGIDGVFINARCVCAGLSHAFKMMCDKRGIDCIYISGYSLDSKREQGRHGWNMVRLNDKWYHIDVTHDQCRSNESCISRCYFLLSTPEILLNHSMREQEVYLPYCFESLNPLLRVKDARQAAKAFALTCAKGGKYAEYRFDSPIEIQPFVDNFMKELPSFTEICRKLANRHSVMFYHANKKDVALMAVLEDK